MTKQVASTGDAAPVNISFKTHRQTLAAVKGMIDKGKFPIIEITNLMSTSGRAGKGGGNRLT